VPRIEHSCGVVHGPDPDQFVVVVAGGNDRRTSHTSTELLYSGDELWTYGPALPFAVNSGSMISDPFTGSVILLGGKNNDGLVNQILRLSYPVVPTSNWEILEKSLGTNRYDQVNRFSVHLNFIYLTTNIKSGTQALK
jgi:hypothetical protein